MIFYPSERIALFVDGINLYSCSKALGFDVDYKKLIQFFCSRGVFVRAFYYTPLCEDQEYSPLRPLTDWLAYNNYHVVTRTAKGYSDAVGKSRLRGKMDVSLILDFVRTTEHVEHLVLFSGDGDLESLVEYAQSKGRRVSVVSTIRTQPTMISDDLRRQADQFIELDLLRPCVERFSGERQAQVNQTCDETL